MKTVPFHQATEGSNGPAAAPGTGTVQAARDAAERFVTLLFAQVQDHDPRNPLENARVTTQLQQIGTLAGIDPLDDAGAALGIAQHLRAASLVGHEVVMGGNDIHVASGKASKGGLRLACAADHVIVTVTDDAGNVVRTMDIGAQNAGGRLFTWDGETDSGATAPDGRYTFSAIVTCGGKAVTFDTLMTAHVEGVVSTSTGAILQLPHGNQIALADVLQIH